MTHRNVTDHITIFDTTLRDGEQSPGCSMTVAEKVRLAWALGDLGVDVIEAGFPIASDGDFEAVRKISRQLRSTTVAALARTKRGDVERAIRALAPAARPRLHTFIATSDLHLRAKLRMSREQVIDEATRAVRMARRHVDDVEWSAEDATRSDIDYLETISRAVVEAGATTINLPDTVGYATPDELGAMVSRICRALPEHVTISVHCHNDLGMATANSLAGVAAGARQVECTMNGIGERAGNCALEEVVTAMRVRQDQLPYATAINDEHLYPTSRLLASIISFGPQPNKAIVGANAFAHEAGIHQDGVLKDPSTYEILAPESVGVPASQLVLGKHSGRSALRQRSAELGYDLSHHQLDSVYNHFVALVDTRKGMTNDEIATLIRTHVETDVTMPVVAAAALSVGAR